MKKIVKGSTIAKSKKEGAKANPTSSAQPLLSPRKPFAIAVAHRRQTHEQQRQYIAALDGFLAEWVRQHLEAAGKRS